MSVGLTPTLMAFEVIDGLEIMVASLAMRKSTRTVDQVAMAGCAMVDHYGPAAALNAARLILELEIATGRLLDDLLLLTRSQRRAALGAPP